MRVATRACELCYTEKATPARHRPERQHNARSNRRKQRSPNETKPYANPTPPRKRQTTPTNGHTPRRRTHVSRTQECALTRPVTSRAATQYLYSPRRCQCPCGYGYVIIHTCVRAHSCVRETCVRRLQAASGVTICRSSLPFARECRLGVWFGFVGAALLPAVGTCVVLAFGAMPGR